MLYDWEWAIADKGEIIFYRNGLLSNIVVRRHKVPEPPPTIEDEQKKVA